MNEKKTSSVDANDSKSHGATSQKDDQKPSPNSNAEWQETNVSAQSMSASHEFTSLNEKVKHEVKEKTNSTTSPKEVNENEAAGSEFSEKKEKQKKKKTSPADTSKTGYTPKPVKASPLLASGWSADSVNWPSKVFSDYVKWHNLSVGQASPNSQKTLSPETAKLYGKFWNKFCERLFENRSVAWYQATQADIEDFLNHVEPRSKREAKIQIQRQTSTVTRQRYETILFKIFHFAGSTSTSPVDLAGLPSAYYGLLDSNPVHLSQVPGSAKREDEDSFILHAHYRKRLLEGINRCANEWEARDAAMLSLMTNEGLTTREICNLQCSEVIWTGLDVGTENWWAKADTWFEAPEPGWIEIKNESRQAQERTLELSPMSREVLRNWIKHRGEILPKKGSTSLLFGKRGEISAVRVYEIAQAHILKCLVKPQDGVDVQTSLSHAGPLALRNCAIMHWFETIPDVQEVRRRAGLMNLYSLRRFYSPASDTAKERFNIAQKEEQESSSEGDTDQTHKDVHTVEMFEDEAM